MLCWYNGAYDDGLILENRAIELLESANETEGLARALVSQAILFQQVDNLEMGIASLSRVLQLLPKIADVNVVMSAHYTLAQHYRKLGKYEKAWQIIQQLRNISTQNSLHAYDFYVEWFEGRLALDQDIPQKAEKHLVRARSGFSVTGAKGLAGLVSLDLAISLTQQGRSRESINVARETLVVLELWKEHAQLGGLWRKLKRAIMTRAITADLLLGIRSATESLEENPPSLRYLNFTL